MSSQYHGSYGGGGGSSSRSTPDQKGKGADNSIIFDGLLPRIETRGQRGPSSKKKDRKKDSKSSHQSVTTRTSSDAAAAGTKTYKPPRGDKNNPTDKVIVDESEAEEAGTRPKVDQDDDPANYTDDSGVDHNDDVADRHYPDLAECETNTSLQHVVIGSDQATSRKAEGAGFDGGNELDARQPADSSRQDADT
jgi:hypothetical protein